MTDKRCSGPCGEVKKLNLKHFVRHPETQQYISTCRACRNARKKQRRAQRKAALLSIPEQTEYLAQRDVLAARRLIITYAQNATPIDHNFLASLQHCCEHYDALLVVLPGRYYNPTSLWSKAMESDEWWAQELQGSIFRGRAALGPNLVVYGDISIRPTAAKPLSGFEVFAGKASAIFGHPKIQLKAVATASRMPRLFLSTGAVTIPNYTDSKEGKKAEAHHVMGAAIVERDGPYFHIRQINATDDGSFIDLDTKFTPNGVQPAPPAEALILGDIHVEKCDQEVLDATLYSADSIAAVVKPKRVVYHDLLDFDVRNHHRLDDMVDRYLRVRGHKVDDVESELRRTVEFLDATPPGIQPIVIASNHDEALDRWLKTAKIKDDMRNAMVYHELWVEMLRDIEEHGRTPYAFELYYLLQGGKRAKFIHRSEPLKICGIMCGFHGDKGTNRDKGGTAESYSKLGVKTIIGHHHTPAIVDGCYQVGITGLLDQDYNALPSSWMHSHCLIYANGKRSLVHIINGRWRAPRRTVDRTPLERSNRSTRVSTRQASSRAA